MKKKITLIVYLSSNSIGRVYPIAVALDRAGFDIEIAGFLIGKNEVHKPYANKYNYKTVYIGNGSMLKFLKGLPQLLNKINGDVIYAFKPRTTTFFIGILKSKFGLSKRLILDAEDDELDFKYKNAFHFLYYFFLRGWNNPDSHIKLLLLHMLLFTARTKTVVSTKLQRRYGGILLHHLVNEKAYDPDLYSKQEMRIKFGLPEDKILLLFAGVPRVHKGIDIIVKALHQLDDDNFLFVGAGPIDNSDFVKAKELLKEKCLLLGSIEIDLMPHLLAAVDIVPTIQKNTRFAESQMPAKLFEALAMEKIIIATDASDIGKILKTENESRGYIIDFDSPDQLREVLIQIKNDPEEAIRRSKNGRKFFLEEASIQANVDKLTEIIG